MDFVMSRDNDRSLFHFEHNSAGGDLDTKRSSFTVERPILVTAVKMIPENQSDTDSDTLAIDVSYSTDGFSSSDVEIAAAAATEYNDTDNDTYTPLRSAVDIALTAAQIASGTAGVRVPSGAVVEVTGTLSGSPADTRYAVIVEYITL